MGSGLFTSIGLGNLDLGIIIIVLCVLLIAVLVIAIMNTVKLSKLTKKYNIFMRGKAAKSLETEIFKMFEENVEIKKTLAENTKDIRKIYRQLTTTFQKMGLVKYDAFDRMGGKLSFCLVLLDEDNDGFLINSVHGTDSSYSYIKRIEAGGCKMELSNEEAMAVKKALGGNTDETD